MCQHRFSADNGLVPNGREAIIYIKMTQFSDAFVALFEKTNTMIDYAFTG